MFKLVLMWCAFYTLVLFLPVSKVLRAAGQADGPRLLLGLLPFALMLSGTIGLYQGQRWATWLSGLLLALLTVWLPIGYQRLVSSGGHPRPLLVVFSLLAAVNIIASSYLVRTGYRRDFPRNSENHKPSS